MKRFFPFSLLVCLTISNGVANPYGLLLRTPNTSFVIPDSTGDIADRVPKTLAASGLFSDINTLKIAPGIIQYDVNASFWSDRAFVTRYLALPGTSKITFSINGKWELPDRSILVKNFFLEMAKGNPTSRQIVETRMLVYDSPLDEWRGFNYQWNDSGTDAVLLDAVTTTKKITIQDSGYPGGQYEYEYSFPSRWECAKCHVYGTKRGQLLGLETAQVNRDFQYATITDNQLRSLNHIGVFSEDIGEDYTTFPKLADPLGNDSTLEYRARSYLQGNCSHCHYPNNNIWVDMNLLITAPLDQALIIDVKPGLYANPAIQDLKIIKPGIPDESAMYIRMMSTVKDERMPPLATYLVDSVGAALIYDWIKSLGSSAIFTFSSPDNTFQFDQAFPNPFNLDKSASISFPVWIHNPAPFQLLIYDISGNVVRTIIDQHTSQGKHWFTWNGLDEFKEPVSSGVYFYGIKNKSSVIVNKFQIH